MRGAYHASRAEQRRPPPAHDKIAKPNDEPAKETIVMSPKPPPQAVGISYSGGTSSEWMIQQVIEEKIARPQHLAVFFADTGDEHAWTYEVVAQVEERCEKAGITFIRCAPEETLPAHLIAINREGRTHADHPPVYVAKGQGAGRATHRCTRVFKTAPMRRAQAAWLASLGLPKQITKWIGFAADEAHRAIKAEAKLDVAWERIDFPAIRQGVTRAQQKIDLIRSTGRAPRFSMCRICPYKTPERWRATPESELSSVYEVDEAIRDLSSVGLTEGDCYLTNRLIPIERLIKKGDPQPLLPGFEPYCDGGACFL